MVVPMMGWLRWFFGFRRDDYMSATYLRDLHRSEAEARNSYISVSIRWPIRKIVNDHGVWNRSKLRKRA